MKSGNRTPGKNAVSIDRPSDTPDTDNVVRLFGGDAATPAPPAAAGELEEQIAEGRRQAVAELDGVIDRLVSLQESGGPVARDGVDALRQVREILRNLDIEDPDFTCRLSYLAIQLDLLAKCFWQVLTSESAPPANPAT